MLSVADRFIRAADIPDQWGLNALIYGEPGSGKTTLIASAQDTEKGRDLLIIDFEGGTRSIADREDITVFRPSSFNEVKDLYEWLLRDEHTFRTIAIDSLTEAYRIGMGEVMKVAKNPELPSLQDFGKGNEKIMKVIRNFRPLAQERGLNIIFTALQTDKTNTAGVATSMPSMSPKSSEGVVSAVDLVGNLIVNKEGQRVLKLKLSPFYVAKVRQPKNAEFKYPDEVIEPTMGRLFDLALEAARPSISPSTSSSPTSTKEPQ